jgi:exodeoxyribonuclease V alpha subunit
MKTMKAMRAAHASGSTVITKFAYSQMDYSEDVESGRLVKLGTIDDAPPFCLSGGLATPQDAECAATVASCCAQRSSHARLLGARGPTVMGAFPAPHGATSPQAIAWQMINEEHTCIVTGGPGTGKSWLIEKLVKAFGTRGVRAKVVALTGVAAVMLAERTGREVLTIHSQFRFDINLELGQGELVDCDVLIVDEASMLDTRLFAAMLLKIPLNTKLVLLGDDKQILSVSRGWPMIDLMRQEVFPRTHLDVTKRMGGGLATFCSLVRDGAMPVMDRFDDSVEFHHLRDNILVKAAVSWYTKHAGDDAVILTPLKSKRTVNVERINELIFSLSKGEELYPGYKEGDRIMATRNNWYVGFANGEIFTLVRKGEDVYAVNKRVSVEINNGTILQQSFTHAWAMSVHKAQGSEFSEVMVVMPQVAAGWVTRNILYTGMTRAKSKLVIIGSLYALGDAIGRQPLRHTALGILLNNPPLAEKLRHDTTVPPPLYGSTVLAKVF